MLRKRLNQVFLCASVIPFALTPLAGALQAHLLSLPPSVASVVVDAVFLTALAGVLLGLICAAGASLRLAATAVSAGLFVYGLYPAVRVGPSDVSWASLAIAWLWTLVSVGTIVVITRRRLGADAILHKVVNAGALVLALLFGNTIIQAYSPTPTTVLHDDQTLDIVARPEARPDIYHIVVDGLGHPDVLRSMYGVDMSREIEDLRRAGFTIPDRRTFANYAQTYQSLASILNADYLQTLAALDETSLSRAPARDLIQASRVARSLKAVGYTFELLSGSYSATEAHHLADRCECSRPMVGEFESTLIFLTPLGRIGLGDLDYVPHRRKVLRTLDALDHLPAGNGPRLVLAHILAPHPPFVFEADGEAVRPPRPFTFYDGTLYPGSDNEYRSGYRAQASFVASRLPRLAAHLEALSSSQGRESVIVIHGDHGPRRLFDAFEASRSDGSESLPVFLAIRWPDRATAPAVTSLVNIYRAIFQRFFIPALGQLPDRAYMSSFVQPYAFVELDPVTFGRR